MRLALEAFVPGCKVVESTYASPVARSHVATKGGPLLEATHVNFLDLLVSILFRSSTLEALRSGGKVVPLAPRASPVTNSSVAAELSTESTTAELLRHIHRVSLLRSALEAPVTLGIIDYGATLALPVTRLDAVATTHTTTHATATAEKVAVVATVAPGVHLGGVALKTYVSRRKVIHPALVAFPVSRLDSVIETMHHSSTMAVLGLTALKALQTRGKVVNIA